jgi:type I restriction enzyme M protein
VRPEQLDAFRNDLAAATVETRAITDRLDAAQADLAAAHRRLASADFSTHTSQRELQAALEPLLGTIKTAQKDIEARHKLWLKLLDTAEKQLRARQSAAFDGRRARELKRTLTAADAKKNEELTIRDLAIEGLRQGAYFIQQTHWLHQRFPEGRFADVPGLCKKVTRADIAANDWSLTSGRYVGVTTVVEEDEDDFQARLAEIHAEIEELNGRAVELAERIGRNFQDLIR